MSLPRAQQWSVSALDWRRRLVRLGIVLNSAGYAASQAAVEMKVLNARAGEEGEAGVRVLTVDPDSSAPSQSLALAGMEAEFDAEAGAAGDAATPTTRGRSGSWRERAVRAAEHLLEHPHVRAAAEAATRAIGQATPVLAGAEACVEDAEPSLSSSSTAPVVRRLLPPAAAAAVAAAAAEEEAAAAAAEQQTSTSAAATSREEGSAELPSWAPVRVPGGFGEILVPGLLQRWLERQKLGRVVALAETLWDRALNPQEPTSAASPVDPLQAGRPLRALTVEEVGALLHAHGLAAAAPALSEGLVDGDLLADLSDRDLRELGVYAASARRQLLQLVAEHAPSTPTPRLPAPLVPGAVLLAVDNPADPLPAALAARIAASSGLPCEVLTDGLIDKIAAARCVVVLLPSGGIGGSNAGHVRMRAAAIAEECGRAVLVAAEEPQTASPPVHLQILLADALVFPVRLTDTGECECSRIAAHLRERFNPPSDAAAVATAAAAAAAAAAVAAAAVSERMTEESAAAVTVAGPEPPKLTEWIAQHQHQQAEEEDRATEETREKEKQRKSGVDAAEDSEEPKEDAMPSEVGARLGRRLSVAAVTAPRDDAGFGSETGPPLLHIPSKELTLLEVVGAGTFGQVYRAKWSANLVAVKFVSQDVPESLFMREVGLLSRLRHPNVVSLYGVIEPEPGAAASTWRQAFVTEFLPAGSLEAYLARKRRQGRAITTPVLVAVASQAAQGLAYLHQQSIVHCDVKPANLLLELLARRNASGEREEVVHIKLNDFGLSQLKPNLQAKIHGTLAYMAPELMQMGDEDDEEAEGVEPAVSEAIDTYGWAVVLWQLATSGEIPFHEELRSMPPVAFMYNVVAAEMRPEMPERAHPTVQALIREGWSARPEDRPSLPDAITRLESLLSEHEQPPLAP